MANYETTQDIIDGALEKVGELTSSQGTSEYRTRALEYANRLYLAVLSDASEFDVELGERWSWAKSENAGTIKLLLPYSIGTIALTQGSTAATLSTIPVDYIGANFSLAGWFFKVGGDQTFYRVVTHTAGSLSMVIDQAYIGASVTTSGFTAYKLDYSLTAGILKLVTPLRVYKSQGVLYLDENNGQILGLEFDVMSRMFPIHILESGTPTHFAVKYLDPTTNTFTLRFNRTPVEETRVEYDYVPYPTDLTDASSSKPIIPKKNRSVLSYGIAYFIALDKNDNRAPEFLATFKAGLKAMVREDKRMAVHVNPDRARVIARRGQWRRIIGNWRIW